MAAGGNWRPIGYISKFRRIIGFRRKGLSTRTLCRVWVVVAARQLGRQIMPSWVREHVLAVFARRGNRAPYRARGSITQPMGGK